MKSWDNIQTYKSGTGLDTLAIDSTGAATPDGTEYIAAQINNGIFGWTQDFMDYASLTPDGVIEVKGASQLREAIQKGNSVGPGMYVQRAIYDAPAVHGDRTIILAEQGVLIATYPELTAAVYVGDANNAAVAAAGGKFYKSSDAGGATPNISGPYIQLPAQPDPKFLKQYIAGNTYNGVALTVTGLNWTTTRAVFVPYKTLEGGFRMAFNVCGVMSVAAGSLAATIAGATFKNVANYTQSITGGGGAGGIDMGQVITTPGSGVMTVFVAAGSTSNYFFSGDVELDSAPTWMEDFDIEWGITY